MGVAAGVDHFADRVWESAKPETGVHLPAPRPPLPAPPGENPRDGHVRIPLLTERSLLFSASEAANISTRFLAPSPFWRE